ncbi:MAG: D-2-hydroxyacid dehydrogenase [Verrucomicrobiota bacterium]|nr:D-2-hydroxyacid dehydrogenase [Verrucomicrobiota bacterium]
MNIIVLDAIPLNPGDLDWAPLKSHGQLTIHDLTPKDQVAERITNADIVYTNKVKISRADMGQAPNLKLISVLATGYDIVDIEAAKDQGIRVCNVAGYSTASTAQLTIALLLEITHHVGAHNDSVKKGDWSNHVAFCYWNFPLVELAGKTLCIVGMGAIGTQVASIAQALGMKIIVAELPGRGKGFSSIQRVPLKDAFSKADFVTLHCPLKPETKHIINQESLAFLKPTSYVINASRGGLVDEKAVADALRSNTIAGYATDVLSTEPPLPDNPLLSAPNCIVTPHIAWASFESRKRLLDQSIENLTKFLAGSPQNVII